MKISKLNTREIIRNINEGKLFEAESKDGGFRIKITKYVPFCCTAIHSGSRIRAELQNKTALNEFQRWYEEDPNTDGFIRSMPITIVGLDSRYEYDLNRSPEDCIYEEAWGMKTWKKPLTEKQFRTSRQKHSNYYSVLHALISRLEMLFKGCVVYDIHSYNYKRWDREVPLFNIGTERIDREKFGSQVDNWLKELSGICLPDIMNTTAENDVFRGLGYNLEFITKNFKNTLVLATEIKKVYCDELTGDVYPRIIRQMQQKLKKAILNNANFFGQNLDRWHHVSSGKLLDRRLDETLLIIDRDLYGLLKNFELLATVNPNNTQAEKKKFFKSRFTEPPVFRYNPVKINPYSLKQKLHSLKISDIQDISIRNLYESVINSYFDKIDMISTLNTEKFLYNSLRYFGRPSRKDLLNASYLFHLPDIPGEAKKEPVYDASGAMEIFREGLNAYGIDAKIEFSNKVISQVMVLNSRRSILIQPEAHFRRRELMGLVEHEIGIHMLTTMNSLEQPLKIFNAGLPVNTLTQEGLAMLAEYLSGNISMKRLRKIALRVIVVDQMCSGADFIECFNSLRNEYEVEPNEAFNMVTRIFRGGGFTKDYLYLAGFVKILRLWEDHYDLTPLLTGKTSLSFLGTIEEMIEREMIRKPGHITRCLLNPKTEENNPIYNYILTGLK